MQYMSDLEDLAKKLSHEKDESELYPARREKIKRRMLDTEPDESLSSFWRSPAPSYAPTVAKARQQEKTMRLRTIFLWTLVIATVLFVIVGGVFFFIAGGGVIGGRDVTFTLEGPSETASGSEAVWHVSIRNENQKAIEGAELVITFPDGERTREQIGTIAPGAEETLEVRRIVFGNEGDEVTIKTVLEYRPQGSSAFFAKEDTASLTIVSSLVGVALEAPREVQAEGSVALAVRVTSNTDTILHDLSLEVEYPEDFLFENAVPAAVEGIKRWRLGDMQPQEVRVIAISGILKQGVTPQKTFRMKVGIFDGEEDRWQVVAQAAATVTVRSSLLALDVRMETQKEGVALPGESFLMSLRWKNNLPVAVENVVIEATPTGEAFDKGSLRLTDATYDETTNTIRWNASTVAALAVVAPGSEGEVSFRMRVHDIVPARTLEDRNFVARVEGRVRAETIPEGYASSDLTSESAAEVKIASKLLLSQKAYFYYEPLPNSGPLPPEVGKETTYTVLWSLQNVSNALEEVTVRAFLPSYARWKGVVSPGSASINYNASRSEITWHVGALSAGVGYTRPALEAAFQIGFLPTSFHQGGEAELISVAEAQGADVFAGIPLSATALARTSAIPDDAKATSVQRKVK
jgi:hypothetical protein